MGIIELADAAWPDSASLLAAAGVISFFAGVVRGFAGFGYSALVVAALSPFALPAPIVLAVLLLEVLASAPLMRSVASAVDGGWHRAIVVGNLVFVPVGVAGLLWLEPSAVRLAVSGLTLLAATSMRLMLGRAVEPTPLLRASAGAMSGVLNGFAASGGIVPALLMAAAGVRPGVLRSTMISVLLWVSAYALAWAVLLSPGGAFANTVIQMTGWAILFWPTMLVGMRLGNLAFYRSGAGQQPAIVLNILILTAAAGVAAGLANLQIPKTPNSPTSQWATP